MDHTFDLCADGLKTQSRRRRVSGRRARYLMERKRHAAQIRLSKNVEKQIRVCRADRAAPQKRTLENVKQRPFRRRQHLPNRQIADPDSDSVDLQYRKQSLKLRALVILRSLQFFEHRISGKYAVELRTCQEFHFIGLHHVPCCC